MFLRELIEFMEQVAPPRLAAEWDNVGLLVGDPGRELHRAMTCLTITPDVAAEAIRAQAELIVTHHPLPFQPLRRLTTHTPVGRLLWDLIGAGVAVYSPHTAWDSAAQGINQRLAVGLGLRGVAPLLPDPAGQGTGRWGWLDDHLTLADLAGRLKRFLNAEPLQMVGDPQRAVRSVAVTCGAADELLEAAVQQNCDVLVLGEARFHTCLEAEAHDVALLMPGHYASERFSLDCLADVLRARFPALTIWASRDERDPIRYA